MFVLTDTSDARMVESVAVNPWAGVRVVGSRRVDVALDDAACASYGLAVECPVAPARWADARDN